MRIKTFWFVVVAMLIATSGLAQNGATGNVIWNLDNDGTLTISGTGAMGEYKLLSSPPWYGSKEDILKLIVEEGVTNIGGYAFYGCTAMESVSIANTVKTIGSSAFYDCASLTTVSIPNSVTEIGKDVFYKCSGLTKLSLGESVEKIGGSLIYECDKLEYLICNRPTPPEISNKFMNETFFGAPVKTCVVLVPDGSEAAYKAPKGWKNFSRFEKIGSSTQTQNNIAEAAATTQTGTTAVAEERSGMDGNISWKINDKSELYISGSGQMKDYTSFFRDEKPPWFSWDNNADVRIGETKMMCYVNRIFISGVENIGSFAFSNCKWVTHVSIPNTVTEIGAQAFSVCESLKTIEIPSSVTKIGVNAFMRSGLAYVTIPNSVTLIEGKAFMSSAIDSISLPNTITEIGSETFSRCPNLLAISIPGSVVNIHQSAFAKSTSLKSVTIEKSDKKQYIRKEAFEGCSSLANVNLPTSVINIDDGAFAGCTSLKTIDIPNSVTAVWVGTFKNCGLESIVLHAAIRMIADSAFDGCSSLTSVTILNPTPPTIGTWAVFRNVSPDCVLKVPKASLAGYKAAGYGKWFKEVVGI